MNKLFIGVDVGGTRTKYGLTDPATGTVYKSSVLPTEKEDEKAFLHQVCEAVRLFQDVALQINGEVGGIGIGVPGFTTEEGDVLTTYGSLPFMEAYPLGQKLQSRISLPVVIDNDARMVCLGEAVFGKGKGFKRVLTLTLGTGVGFGFVVDRRFTDAVPLSHMGGNMRIADEGGDCYCGKRGCLEALVSSTGIENLAGSLGVNGNRFLAETIFSDAQAGHPNALAVVKKVCAYLHTAIHNYVNLFAPGIVVLGGGIAKSLAPYVNEIKGRSYMGPFPVYDFTLAVSDLQESAGMLGAAALALSLKKQ